MFNNVIKQTILEENNELFDVLRTSIPSIFRNFRDDAHYCHALDKGLFHMACILLENHSTLVKLCAYLSVKAYYTHKTKPNADKFMNVMVSRTGFESAIIYYSLYIKDALYQQVLNHNRLENSLCLATMMCNYEALNYMISHFQLNEEIVFNLFHYNVYKDEDVYKILLDTKLYDGKMLLSHIRSVEYLDIIRNKIIRYLDQCTHFNNVQLENRLATINKMHTKPIPKMVYEYLSF